MIKKPVAEAVLSRALAGGADFAELYFEDGASLYISYNQRVTDIARQRSRGVGLYLIKGTESVYVYSSDTSEQSLGELCVRGTALLRGKARNGASAAAFSEVCIAEPNPVAVRPGEAAHRDKIALLENCDRAARAEGRDVVNVDLSYNDYDKSVLIANSEGVWARDSRAACQIRLTPTVSDGKDSIGYFVNLIRPMGFEMFDDGSYETFANDAIRDMRGTLRASETPTGRFPVLLDAGTPSGTFFHECCGHQLETNHDLLSGSIFTGKLGTRIGSEKVTMIDDGTLPNMHGSSKFDDEGMPRQRNILIENGILKSYLVNRMGSIKLGVARNGSGRRQNYTFAPAARMSNTYLAAGEDDLEEMIRSMPEGLYITRMGGGFGGADFTIVAHTAYWIKNGAIDRQVKNAMLVGRGDEALMKIDRVGKRLLLEKSGSNCGGASGICDVTTSGAAMRVGEMMIGGKGGSGK